MWLWKFVSYELRPRYERVLVEKKSLQNIHLHVFRRHKYWLECSCFSVSLKLRRTTWEAVVLSKSFARKKVRKCWLEWPRGAFGCYVFSLSDIAIAHHGMQRGNWSSGAPPGARSLTLLCAIMQLLCTLFSCFWMRNYSFTAAIPTLPTEIFYDLPLYILILQPCSRISPLNSLAVLKRWCLNN